MKQLLGPVLTFALLTSAQAGITGVSITDNSSPTVSDGTLATRYGEFATQSTVGPIGVTGDTVSFTHQMQWYNGFLSVTGGTALTHLRSVSFDLAFTIEDPLSQGYRLQIDTICRGYTTAEWGSSTGNVTTVGTSISGRIDTDSTDGLDTLGTQLSGLTLLTSANTSANQTTPFSHGFDERSVSLDAGAFVGTRTFTLRFTTAGSPQTNVFMANGMTGQGSVLFGLTNTDPALNGTSEPQAGDAYAYSELGHFTKVNATYNAVPEPSAWALVSGLTALAWTFRRRSFRGG